MTWIFPHALVLLLLLPLLALAYFRLLRRRTAALRLPDLKLVRTAHAQTSPLRRHASALLLLCSVAGCVIAIARPALTVKQPAEHRSVILAIDVSLSMAAEDVKPSRLSAAKIAAIDFVRRLPRDVRLGVISFSGSADLVVPPTTNRARVITAIEGLDLAYGTSVGSAVLAALMTLVPDAQLGGDYDIFGMGRTPASFPELALDAPDLITLRTHKHEEPPAAIVLLSDGYDTSGMPAAKAGRIASSYGVRIHTIGFGTNARPARAAPPMPEGMGFDESALKALARVGGGRYFRAADARDLRIVYESLQPHIVTETKELELSSLANALAALLLVAAGAVSVRRAGVLQLA